MVASESPLYYKPELFENLSKVARTIGWLESEVLWEAWLTDTILLVANCLKSAVLSGGSGVRNITKVYRLTYDVDFDCQEDNIDVIFDALKNANVKLGGRRSLDNARTGLITTERGSDVRESFRGPNRLAKFSRWTENGRKPLKLHIMHVPDMPEMFPGDSYKLESVFRINASVPTASRKCLFYRKAIRANKETRPEDFLDLTFILEKSTPAQVAELHDYCAVADRKPSVVKGVENLIMKRKDFRSQIETRLAHARPEGSIDEWIEAKGNKLSEFVRSLS